MSTISKAFGRYNKNGSKTTSAINLAQEKPKVSVSSMSTFNMIKASVSDNIKEEADDDDENSDEKAQKSNEDFRRADSTPAIDIARAKIIENESVMARALSNDDKAPSNSSADPIESSAANSLSIMNSMTNITIGTKNGDSSSLGVFSKFHIVDDCDDGLVSKLTTNGPSDFQHSSSMNEMPDTVCPEVVQKADGASECNNDQPSETPQPKTTVLFNYVDVNQSSRRPSQIEYLQSGYLKFQSDNGICFFIIRDDHLWAYENEEVHKNYH